MIDQAKSLILTGTISMETALAFLGLVIILLRVLLRRTKRIPKPFICALYAIDGDTVKISGQRGRDTIRIRLDGIDAPEKGQSGGNEAHDALTALIRGEKVLVSPTAIDVYGRIVAHLSIDGRDVSSAMVSGGFALALNSGSLRRMERRARASKSGLWAHGRISSPSEHRRTA